MRRALIFSFVVASIASATRSSDAHFVLQAPASWMSQDGLGSPQKLGPCGDEDDGTALATPTGTVTAYQVGDTITVTINETIFHPGHYRIALAVSDRTELPPEPAVDAGSTYPCGTAVIENPPVFPVLADDVFDHTAPFSGPQTTTVKIPSNVTCNHCTLQVIEFMSDHGLNNPGGCFYHHCADISVGGDAGTQNDAAVGAEPEPQTTSGCSCSVPSRAQNEKGGGIAIAMLAAFVAIVTRSSCASRASRRRKCRQPD